MVTCYYAVPIKRKENRFNFKITQYSHKLLNFLSFILKYKHKYIHIYDPSLTSFQFPTFTKLLDLYGTFSAYKFSYAKSNLLNQPDRVIPGMVKVETANQRDS